MRMNMCIEISHFYLIFAFSFIHSFLDFFFLSFFIEGSGGKRRENDLLCKHIKCIGLAFCVVFLSSVSLFMLCLVGRK